MSKGVKKKRTIKNIRSYYIYYLVFAPALEHTNAMNLQGLFQQYSRMLELLRRSSEFIGGQMANGVMPSNHMIKFVGHLALTLSSMSTAYRQFTDDQLRCLINLLGDGYPHLSTLFREVINNRAINYNKIILILFKDVNRLFYFFKIYK